MRNVAVRDEIPFFNGMTLLSIILSSIDLLVRNPIFFFVLFLSSAANFNADGLDLSAHGGVHFGDFHSCLIQIRKLFE